MSDYRISAPRPYMCITNEPPTFQKFIYKSQKNDPTGIRCHIVLNSSPPHPVFITCDLYSQIGGKDKKLSPNYLVHKNFDPNNFDPFLSYEVSAINGQFIHFTLEHVHVLYIPQKKNEDSLIRKLRYMKHFEFQRQLTDDEERKLIAQVKYMFLDQDYQEGKVYIGFTAYARDPVTNMMEIYAETEFSWPIYDNNNSSFLEPFVGCISGGSVHKLKGPVCLTHDIRILLNDQHGWEASATEVRVDEGYTYFKIPPYTAAWHDEDDTRLVHIKFYGCDACKRKKAIKFLYKRLDGPLGLMWE